MSNAFAAIAERRRRRRGFSLLELMIVVAIIVILALIALPSAQDKIVRDRIVEGAKLADVAKPAIAVAWSTTGLLPANNAAAGLPVPEKIVSDQVSSVAVESGAIQITFGNQANAAIRGKVLTLRPAVVEDARIVPITWVCGEADAPDKMTLHGTDRTTVPARFLPLNCRARTGTGGG